MLLNVPVKERRLINYRSIRVLSINSAKLHFRSVKFNAFHNYFVSCYSLRGRINYQFVWNGFYRLDYLNEIYECDIRSALLNFYSIATFFPSKLVI